MFVSLGVKGSEKTLTAIGGVRQGLKETASTAWETKVALVGAMYALERLFATSGQTGTNLTNFNAMLGGSTQSLQQYQYAARQAGVANQEVEATFKGLAAASTKLLLGQGDIAGAARVALVLKTNLNPELDAAANGHPEALLQRLQQYAQSKENIGLGNIALKSFGLTDNIIAAMRRNAFRPEVLKQAPTYGANEIKSLDKSNIAWSNLGNKVEMAVGHFNAVHGQTLVKDLSKITDQVIKLANAFEKLSEKAELFKWLGKIFEGWTLIFAGLTVAIEKLADTSPPEMGEDGKPQRKLSDSGKVDQSQSAFDRFLSAMFLGAGPGGNGLIGAIPDALKAWSEGTQKVVPGWSAAADKYSFDPNKPKTAAPATPPAPVVGNLPAVVKGMVAPQPQAAGGKAGTPPTLKLVVPPSPMLPAPAKAATPPVKPDNNHAGITQKIDVKQSLNFSHDGKDAEKTANSTKQAVRDAYRQTAAQGQVT